MFDSLILVKNNKLLKEACKKFKNKFLPRLSGVAMKLLLVNDNNIQCKLYGIT